MQKERVVFSITLIICLGVLSCAASPKEEAAPLKLESHKTAAEKTTIKAITDNPDQYKDRFVQLEGVFKGWKGGCKGGPPITRSDWMIDDDTGCIYVSGGIPGGLQPMAPKHEKIVLKGVVRVSGSGNPYIKIQSL